MLELRLGARAARAIGGRLRAVAEHLDAGSLRDGSWFERLTAAHLAAHAQKVDSRRWDRRYPGVPIEQRARREVEKASRRAAAAGALAAVLASGGELVTLATDGLAGPVGVPAALLSIGLDAVYQALMQVNLVLDLGVIYEAPFGADEVGAIAALFALALATEPPSSTEGPM